MDTTAVTVQVTANGDANVDAHKGLNPSDPCLKDIHDNRHNERDTQRGILYGLEDVPPWYATIMFGLQQLLSSFGGIVSVSIIVGVKMCMSHDTLIMTRLLCSGFLICGLGTLLQSTFGSRLPIIQGNGAFFVSVFAILDYKGPCPVAVVPGNSTLPQGNSTHDEFDSLESEWRGRMLEIQGGILVGSCIQVLLGVSGCIGFLLRYIGPLTITPTVALVGLAIVPPAVQMSGDHWGIAGLTIVSITLLSQYLSPYNIPIPAYKSERKFYIGKAPIFQLFPLIISILTVWLLCLILTNTGVFPDDPSNPAYNARTDIKLDVLDVSPWFWFPYPDDPSNPAYNARTDIKLDVLDVSPRFWFPYPGQWGRPIVTAGTVFGIIAGVMCSILESIGDYYATARIAEAPKPPSHAINRGIIMEGIACIFAGAWGTGIGVTSYSDAVGNIGITKVGSRIVTQTAAILMILLALFAKVGALIATIPHPIIGGALFVGGCMVIAIGLSNLQFVDLNKTRNLFVLGVSLCCGHGIPLWLSGHEGVIKTGSSGVDAVLTILLTNTIFIGGLTGFVLDNSIPGTLKERGMLKWCEAPDENDQTTGTVKSYDLPFGMTFIRRSTVWRYLPFSPTFQGFPWDKDSVPNSGKTETYNSLDEHRSSHIGHEEELHYNPDRETYI